MSNKCYHSRSVTPGPGRSINNIFLESHEHIYTTPTHYNPTNQGLRDTLGSVLLKEETGTIGVVFLG